MDARRLVGWRWTVLSIAASLGTLAIATPATADTYDHVAGVGSAFTGQEGVFGTNDGPLDQATFYDVTGIATDGDKLYASVVKSVAVAPTQTPDYGDQTGSVSESWIRQIDLNTGQVSTIYHHGSSSSGNYYAGPIVYNDGALYFLTYQGTTHSSSGTTTPDPDDPPRATLDKLDLTGDTQSQLYEWPQPDPSTIDARNPDGSYAYEFDSPPSLTGGLAVGNGYLYAVDEGCEQQSSSTQPFDSTIWKLALDGSDSSVLATLPTGGNGQWYRACGELKVGDYESGKLYVSNANDEQKRQFSIYSVDTADGSTTPIIDTSAMGDDVPPDLGISPSDLEFADGMLFASFENQGRIWSIDPATGSHFDLFAGNGSPSPDQIPRYQGQMGIGDQLRWTPGAMEDIGKTLYVADRVGDADNGWGEPGYNHHVIRQLQILPDTAPPEGDPTGEPAPEGASARTRSASAAKYTLKLNAIDKKSAWRPSGVGYYRLIYGGQTHAWAPYKATVTANLPASGASVQFKDRANNVSTPTAVVFRPDTRITSGPSGTVATRTATFKFASTPAGARFECKLDGAPYSACSSGKTYTGLTARSHTFRVRATNKAGADTTPATRSWTIK